MREPLANLGAKAFARIARSRGHLTNSAKLAGGYCAQVLLQMVYFLILTRMLGPDRFGQFAAALAAINLVSPLAGLGFSEVALVRVSQDKKSTLMWAANATLVTAVMGCIAAIGLAFAAALLAGNGWLDWYVVLGLAISELVLVRCCLVVGRIHQARGEITRCSAIHVAVAAMKALIALSLFLSGQESLLLLVILLDVCFSPLLLLLVIKLNGRIPLNAFSWADLMTELRLAVSFGTSVVCKAVYTDLDKLFLARWTTPYVVGTYAAGYKMLSLSFMPIRAVLEATFPRQIQLATQTQSACLWFTSKVLLLNTAIASTIAAGFFIFAPWVTLVLGEDFEESVGVLRIGFLLPVLQAFHYTLGNYLTAIGHQTVRTVVQMFVLLVYVIAGVIFIPLYSWQGAIWTSLSCELLLGSLFAVSCFVFFLKDQNAK